MVDWFISLFKDSSLHVGGIYEDCLGDQFIMVEKNKGNHGFYFKSKILRNGKFEDSDRCFLPDGRAYFSKLDILRKVP